MPARRTAACAPPPRAAGRCAPATRPARRSRATSLAAGRLTRCSACRVIRSTSTAAPRRGYADEQRRHVGELLGLHRRLEPGGRAGARPCRTPCATAACPSSDLHGRPSPSPTPTGAGRLRLPPVRCGPGLSVAGAGRDEEAGRMAAREQARRPARAGRSAADGSPLDVMLTDAALGPVRRLLPGGPGSSWPTAWRPGPVDTTRHDVRTAVELGKVVVGRSEVEPGPRDKRFADPAWTRQPGAAPALPGLPRRRQRARAARRRRRPRLAQRAADALRRADGRRRAGAVEQPVPQPGGAQGRRSTPAGATTRPGSSSSCRTWPRARASRRWSTAAASRSAATSRSPRARSCCARRSSSCSSTRRAPSRSASCRCCSSRR